MTNWNARQLITQLAALADAVPDVTTVKVGVPSSLGDRLAAYVCLAGRDAWPAEDITRVLYRDQRILVVFTYRVANAEADAELKLADSIEQFEYLVSSDPTLDQLIAGDKVDLDAGLADQIEYQLIAGQEFRVYPVVVHCYQGRDY